MSIKVCIWDVGGVFYDYSLEPFLELLQAILPNTDPASHWESITAPFDHYMMGKINLLHFCKSTFGDHAVSAYPDIEDNVRKAFIEGLGTPILECHDLAQEFYQQGVRNVLLTNAIPALADHSEATTLIPECIQPSDRFTSFEIGELKPNEAAYHAILMRTEAVGKNCIFIDDKQENIDGARQVGIHGVRYKKGKLAEDVKKTLSEIAKASG